MAKNIDFEAGHSPITGTLNAAYTALTVAAVGHETGLPPTWVMGAAAVGAVGSAVAGGSREPRLSGESIALRASAWLAGGGWVSYALAQDNIWSWGVVGPMLAAACGFGSIATAIGAKKAKAEKRNFEMHSALFRVKTGQDWSDRIARVAHVEGCQIINVEQWTNANGTPSGAGYTLEIKMPLGGSNWRSLAAFTNELAADANLPEGCGIEVFAGNGRAYAIVKVSTMNALNETQNVPHDATPLDFEKPFDIGVLRDAGLAMIHIREFSAMLVGAKRTGKTNELLAIMTRLIRMPNLRIWVIDFNGGGVALQWLRAWDALGRPGRPPIDWVASTPQEAEQMAMAAVRVAKARKVGYQQLMADADTDLLPMTPEIPGIVMITDEGAEVYANPAHRSVSDPMKEVLRIAGSSGVNQINCFLRATVDTTGDTIVKSQSRVRIGMRMADEAEISYLFGYRSGVKPEDMPEQGFGGVSMDEASSASIFRGWRVLPSDIKWFVENTVDLRQNEAFDEVSTRALGEVYQTRWADDRAGYIFSGSKTPVGAVGPAESSQATETPSEGFLAGRPAIDETTAKANLHKAIEDHGGDVEDNPSDDEFDRVLSDAGVTDWDDPSTWPDGVRPERPAPPKADPNESDSLRAVIFGLVKAMSPDGIQVKDIMDALARMYGEDDVPTRQTITRWLREDDRIHKPTGYGRYSVRPEEM